MIVQTTITFSGDLEELQEEIDNLAENQGLFTSTVVKDGMNYLLICYKEVADDEVSNTEVDTNVPAEESVKNFSGIYGSD